MDIKQLHEHVIEECDGACDYIRNAIEYKSTKPTRAKSCYDMAAQEMSHAEYALTFFNEDYNDITSAFAEENIPEYLTELKAKTTKYYQKKYTEVRLLMELFSR